MNGLIFAPSLGAKKGPVMFTTVSAPALVSIPKTRAAVSSKDVGPVFAVIELEVTGEYRPKNPDSCPCEELGSMPADLVCRFASMFNAERHAKQQKKWACVGLNGAMFFVRGIEEIDRPANPAAFPPAALTGLTWDEASNLQQETNAERLRFARVPRRWTIALRPLIAVEGGDQ